MCGLRDFSSYNATYMVHRKKENGTDLESQAKAGKSPVRETFFTEQRDTQVRRDT